MTDKQWIVVGILGVVAICVCGALGFAGIAMLANNRDSTQTAAEAPVEAPTEVSTETPTDEPVIVPTEAPTDEPVIVPTEAPTEDIPEPIELSGSGNAVVDIEKGEYPAIITISGDNEGEGLIVTHYGADGEWLNLLVSATGPYVGTRPLDFGPNQLTKQIVVEAVGEWKMTIEHLSKAKVLEIPGIHNGTGDDVLIVKPMIPGLTPDTAAIKGNQNSDFLAVLGYTGEGYFEILAQSEEPYEGVVKVDNDLRVLDVSAEGDWIIGVGIVETIEDLEQSPGVIIVTVDKEDEFVIIQNVSSSPVDLAGWRLLSEKGPQNCDLNGVIQPNDTLQVWALAARIDQGGYNCGFDSNIWNNSETDPAVLFDQNGIEVYRVDCDKKVCP